MASPNDSTPSPALDAGDQPADQPTAQSASTSASTAAPSPSHVAALSVKLPPFWPSDPQLWFAQVEAQFSTRGITTESTKFGYVVSSLDHRFAHEVRDLLITPPETQPYTNLKRQLIERLTASAHQRVRQLLHDEQLGDRKPTQFLRHLQQLQGDANIDQSILSELFLQRLPANVRMVLAASSGISLEEQAKLADRILDLGAPLTNVPTPSSQVNVVSAAPSVTGLEALQAEIAALRADLARVNQPPRPRSRSRGRSLDRGDQSRTRGRSSSPGRAAATDRLCYYHRRFGADARNCRPPCSHQSGNGPASQ